MATKNPTPLTSLLGPAHPTIKATEIIKGTVYPIYTSLPVNVTDAKGNVNNVAPAAFSVIKGGEILGPYADPYVAADTASYRLALDRERGISNP